MVSTTFTNEVVKFGIEGEISEHVLSYFAHMWTSDIYFKNLPYLTVLIELFNQRKAIPHLLIQKIDYTHITRAELCMMWPVDFNLALPSTKFSSKHKLPTYEEFPNKLLIKDDRTYIRFMQALRLFFLTQFRYNEVSCTKEEIEFAFGEPHLMRNICMYFGFAFEEQTFNKF